MYKTTKKDFAEFKKEAEYWIKYFGLSDWSIFIEHKDMNDCRADCMPDIPGKICTIGLAIPWVDKPGKNELKQCAFHEVCETMMCQLSYFGKQFHNS